MNANELADELSKQTGGAGNIYIQVATMLRQQQTEIEAGKIMIKGYGKTIDEQQAEILILKNALKNCKKIIKAQEK